MIKSISNTLFNIMIAFVLVLILSVLVYGLWNVVGVWAIPSLGTMPFSVALGLSFIFYSGSNILNYWSNRFIAIRKAKALKELEVIELLFISLSARVQHNEKVLVSKGIIQNEDVIKDIP